MKTKDLFLTATIVGVALLLTSGTAGATAFNYTITPEDLATNYLEFMFNPFGYDWDEAPPIGVDEAGPSGWGASCWASEVDGSATGTGRDYTALRLNPAGVFGVAGMTVLDLDAISYWSSNQNTDLIDWQIKIYTFPTEDGPWYGHRFNFARGDATDSDWHQWGTDNLGVEWIRSGSGASSYGDFAWSEIQSQYGSEQIMFIDIIASYMTSSPPSNSLLDGVVLEYNGEDIAYINLANSSVPEPATMTLLGLGLAGMALRRYRKRN